MEIVLVIVTVALVIAVGFAVKQERDLVRLREELQTKNSAIQEYLSGQEDNVDLLMEKGKDLLRRGDDALSAHKLEVENIKLPVPREDVEIVFVSDHPSNHLSDNYLQVRLKIKNRELDKPGDGFYCAIPKKPGLVLTPGEPISEELALHILSHPILDYLR